MSAIGSSTFPPKIPITPMDSQQLAEPMDLVDHLFNMDSDYSEPLDYTPPTRLVQDACVVPILTPALKQRETRKLVLENGLQVYLVHDTELAQSAAALSVGEGSFSDPEAYPGMAHFVEHLLFMGNEKYPNHGDFLKFISSRNGSRNAWTSDEETCYHFHCDHDAFPDGLDRFSAFFSCPTFNPDHVAKEIHAIENEYADAKLCDRDRLGHILKLGFNPEHPASRFSIGNTKTLEDLIAKHDQTLQNWFREHYCPEKMNLVIYSPLPLQELESLVIRNFATLPPVHKCEDDCLIRPLLGDEWKGKLLRVAPLKKFRTLNLIFELPSQFAGKGKVRPEDLVGHILGDEGEGSLFQQLKAERLVTGIASGGGDRGAQNHLFSAQISLTPLGLDKLSTVIERFYQTVAAIRLEGCSQALFDSIQQEQVHQYQNQERGLAEEDAASDASALHNEYLRTYPEKSSILQPMDLNLVKEYASHLEPNKAWYILEVPEDELEMDSYQTEPYLGGRFQVEPIADEALERWKQVSLHPNIQIPQGNPFLPSDLSLKHSQTGNRACIIPECLGKNDRGILYYSPDRRYSVPKVCAFFNLISSLVHPGDPKASVLNTLLSLDLSEQLNAILYEASMAGLDFNVHASETGLLFHLSGFNDKAPLLMEEVQQALERFQANPLHFEHFIDQIRQVYASYPKAGPVMQAMDRSRKVLLENHLSPPELLSALEEVTWEAFREFAQKYTQKHFLAGTVYGNVHGAEAWDFYHQLKAPMGNGAFPTNEHALEKAAALPSQRLSIHHEADVENHGMALSISLGKRTSQKAAVLSLLDNFLDGAFFDTLRTQQNTAYAVQAGSSRLGSSLFANFTVQSSTHDPRDLLKRSEAFLADFVKNIRSHIEEKEFESAKKGIIAQLRKGPDSQEEMGAKLHFLATERGGDFRVVVKLIQSLKALSYEEFIGIVQGLLDEDNSRRLASLVYGKIDAEKAVPWTPTSTGYQEVTVEEARNLCRYRA